MTTYFGHNSTLIKRDRLKFLFSQNPSAIAHGRFTSQRYLAMTENVVWCHRTYLHWMISCWMASLVCCLPHNWWHAILYAVEMFFLVHTYLFGIGSHYHHRSMPQYKIWFPTQVLQRACLLRIQCRSCIPSTCMPACLEIGYLREQ